jgi:hypothetical protein
MAQESSSNLPRAQSISLDHLIETATSAALRAFDQHRADPTKPDLIRQPPWIWVGIIASPAGLPNFGGTGPGGGFSQPG